MRNDDCRPLATMSFEETVAALRNRECDALSRDTVIDFLQDAHRREIQEIVRLIHDKAPKTEMRWSTLGKEVFNGEDVGSIIGRFETPSNAWDATGCVNAVMDVRELLEKRGYSV